MTTVICPKCGTENPSDAVHCRKCRIILKMALEQVDNNEVSTRETEPDVILNSRVSRDSWVVTNIIGFIVPPGD